MPGRTLMVQGTGSHVGKSLLVAALCRMFRQDGVRVAPFKAQNMSNNAAVCPSGGEIARAQAVQAQACGVPPSVHMNPILLKPCGEAGAQVVVHGRPMGTLSAQEYQAHKLALLGAIQESLDRLRAEYDLVVMEGAGSPVEVNLRDRDLANMRVACLVQAPVLLVGDIDRGGIFAQLLGTLHLLRPKERELVAGLVVNKFRGDLSILQPGLDFLACESGLPVLGVLPYVPELHLPEEDTGSMRPADGQADPGRLRIHVVRLPHIANFTDLDALRAEPDVTLRYLDRSEDRIPDALILPGTKTTIPDLRHLKRCGLAAHVERCVEAGAVVVGLCGGFQMLGRRVLDPFHVESEAAAEDGLGWLDAVTVMDRRKQTALVRAVHLGSGLEVEGYEIHMGCTQEGPEAVPVFRVVERCGIPADGFDGLAARGGRVWGTYLHGVFDAPAFRREFLNGLRARRGWGPLAPGAALDLEGELDRLASLVRSHLDVVALYRIAGLPLGARRGRS